MKTAYYLPTAGYWEYDNQWHHKVEDTAFKTINWIHINQSQIVLLVNGKIESLWKPNYDTHKYFNGEGIRILRVPEVWEPDEEDYTGEVNFESICVEKAARELIEATHNFYNTPRIVPIVKQKEDHTLDALRYVCENITINTEGIIKPRTGLEALRGKEFSSVIIHENQVLYPANYPQISFTSGKNVAPEVFEGIYAWVDRTKKCECGAESIGYTTHSSWCIKYAE